MAHIQLIYGDEPQLIEEEKRKFLSAYPDLPVTVLDDEAGPQKISEKLCEDSLFGDQKVFCLVNLPIIRKSGKNSDAWVPLYELIMEYNGNNPILLIYHDMIDKRIKQNKEILDKIPNHQCKRLEGADLVMWIRQSCTSNGFKMKEDTILVDNLPTSFEGFKIIQLSDLKISSTEDIKRLKKIVNKSWILCFTIYFQVGIKHYWFGSVVKNRFSG